MIKKVLFTALLILIWACSEKTTPSNAEATSENSSEESFVPESSSSEETSSSSEEIPSNEELSSSNEEVLATESSSSSSAEAKVLSELPFDTTTAHLSKRIYTSFLHIIEENPEEEEYFKAEYGNDLSNLYYEVPDGYCYAHTSNQTIQRHFYYMESYNGLDKLILNHNDSLLIAEADDCSSMEWGGCKSYDSTKVLYYQKININGQDFYYGKSSKWEQLISMTDSTMTIWYIYAPDYKVPCWDAKLYENTLAQVISCDTMIVEKYGLTLVQKKNSNLLWIFENETCTTDYKRTHDVKTNCEAQEEAFNSGYDCIKRNMGVKKYWPTTSLCKGNNTEDEWCFLVNENPELSESEK